MRRIAGKRAPPARPLGSPPHRAPLLGAEHQAARRLAEPVYAFKTLVEEDSGRILGAHLVGPRADEVIDIFVLAIRHDLTVENLKATIFAYPTATSDVSYMI